MDTISGASLDPNEAHLEENEALQVMDIESQLPLAKPMRPAWFTKRDLKLSVMFVIHLAVMVSLFGIIYAFAELANWAASAMNGWFGHLVYKRPIDLTSDYVLRTLGNPMLDNIVGGGTYRLVRDIATLVIFLIGLVLPIPGLGFAGIALAATPYLSFSVAHFFTNAIKLMAGRLRPDFLDRCQMVDGVCTGNPTIVFEGRLSFPSGHSSLSMSVSAAIACYLLVFVISAVLYHRARHRFAINKRFAEMTATDVIRTGHRWVQTAVYGFIALIPLPITVAVAASPLLFGTWVGITRTLDNHHHPTDVIAGLLLGFIAAVLMFGSTIWSVVMWTRRSRSVVTKNKTWPEDQE